MRHDDSGRATIISGADRAVGPILPIPRERRWIDAVGLLLIALATTGAYLVSYRLHPSHPHIGGNRGWWMWFDQSWYFSSTKALAEGNLDPSLHMYLPGYSLLGSVFVRFLSVHAFLPVNLLCLLASLLFFSRIAVRLAPAGLPHAGLIGAAVFALTSVGSPSMREIWVVPWSSSGATPLIYGALLAAIRAVEKPQQASRVYWVGLATGAIAAFRPTDLLPPFLAGSLGIGLMLLRRPWHWRLAAASAAYGAAGLTCSLALLGAAYVSIYGLTESHYVVYAGLIGFEWRSLPLRWVTLGLSPQPLFNQGEGLIAAFPWMPIGLAAFAVYLITPPLPASRLIHLIVISASVLQMIIYLTFRDLYPEGLFLYENYHYYKFVIPFLSLYAIMLAYDLVVATSRRRLRGIALACVVLAILLPWRAEFADIRPIPRQPTSDPRHDVAFQSGFTSVSDAILVAATGTWQSLYLGNSTLKIDGHFYIERFDYKLHPTAGGFFVAPLRPLPAGHALLTLDPSVVLDPALPLLHARQKMALGLPCWLPELLHRCSIQAILPPPILPPDGAIPTDESGQAFLAGAWSRADAEGRWTAGDRAILRAQLPPMSAPLQLQMKFSPFMPPGSDPLRTVITVGATVIAEQHFESGLPTTLTATIPAALLPKDGTLAVTISVINPRRPSDYYPQSADTRRLGLFVRDIRLVHPRGDPA